MLTAEKSVDERIKKLIKIKNSASLTQEKIAREIGVTVQTCHNWINDKRKPRSEVQLSGIDRFIGKYSEFLNKK